MSRRDKQTNKETPVQPKGRPTRAQRKSIIAAAIGFEDVQGVQAGDGVTATASPQFNAAQTSAFSAFGKDAARTDAETFESRHVNNAYAEIAPVNEMTKQCSMVYRMAEKDKRDVDPRDLHKLLPSTMLTSESLDLRPDGRIARGASGMDVHKVMEDQAMQFNAESGKGMPEHELSVGNVSRLTPTAEEQHQGSPPNRRMRSVSNQGLMSVEQSIPNSPVTGWPAAAVLGIMHPMNHTLSHIAKTHAGAPTELVASSPLIYSDSNTAMARLTGAPGGMLLDWAAYANRGPQIYPPTSYPTATTTPVILEHPSQEEQYAMNYHHSSQASPDNVSHETASSKESDSGSSEKDGSGDGASKKFKSLEAALAWCHVQHSQKQVPVVPKDDVRRLVDFQLNSGKPIRAPWYRPQGDKAEDTKPAEKPVEKKPIVTPPRMRPPVIKVKKQGTGFFCPPGAPLARV